MHLSQLENDCSNELIEDGQLLYSKIQIRLIELFHV